MMKIFSSHKLGLSSYKKRLTMCTFLFLLSCTRAMKHFRNAKWRASRDSSGRPTIRRHYSSAPAKGRTHSSAPATYVPYRVERVESDDTDEISDTLESTPRSSQESDPQGSTGKGYSTQQYKTDSENEISEEELDPTPESTPQGSPTTSDCESESEKPRAPAPARSRNPAPIQVSMEFVDHKRSKLRTERERVKDLEQRIKQSERSIEMETENIDMLNEELLKCKNIYLPGKKGNARKTEHLRKRLLDRVKYLAKDINSLFQDLIKDIDCPWLKLTKKVKKALMDYPYGEKVMKLLLDEYQSSIFENIVNDLLWSNTGIVNLMEANSGFLITGTAAKTLRPRKGDGIFCSIFKCLGAMVVLPIGLFVDGWNECRKRKWVANGLASKLERDLHSFRGTLEYLKMTGTNLFNKRIGRHHGEEFVRQMPSKDRFMKNVSEIPTSEIPAHKRRLGCPNCGSLDAQKAYTFAEWAQSQLDKYWNVAQKTKRILKKTGQVMSASADRIYDATKRKVCQATGAFKGACHHCFDKTRSGATRAVESLCTVVGDSVDTLFKGVDDACEVCRYTNSICTHVVG